MRMIVRMAAAVAVPVIMSPPLSSQALAILTARPRTAIGIASGKWIGTGANRRLTNS